LSVATSASAAVQQAPAHAAAPAQSQQVRVRFAPSPTGNLHVGGARTALFNWLYARQTGGKFILRVEDTDTARSTRESEDAMVRDLKWLGLDWDEGPDVGGPCGPYRQSERTAIYKTQVDKLVAAGKAYPCFCTDEELEAMKKDAEEKKLPPIYRGKWATASQAEVEATMATGLPYCYRFRVPSNEDIKINDLIRGDVTWNTDTLGDFVVLRSNGMPVYNFCVAVDDALMGITHVLRAEEHLPNTLRQMLIYQALGFQVPQFGHVSLILAPDKSKLSKRHGATSVGEFRTQGYLAPAMLNFLSLLGWNDGTEQEIFTIDELTQKFGLGRITKSAAVFDKVKLGWMNGQHLRSLPEEESAAMTTGHLVSCGLLASADSAFARAAVKLVSKNMELVTDCEPEVRKLLGYPLAETLASPEAKVVLDDGFPEVAKAVIAAHESGDLAAALAGGHDGFKAWINSVGKAQKRKGKRLFMPVRIAFTGRMSGADVGEQLELLGKLPLSEVAEAGAYVPLDDRMEQLKAALQL
ncbi:Glutamate--tRNA ligase, chloroplastic/mitochondrial, partial [Tetrabaena socialis]